jgi:hypothetical protein
MSLTLEEIDDHIIPRLRCDHCHELITEAAFGNLEYPLKTTGIFYLLHKGCSRPFWETRGGRYRTAWLGLDEFVALLAITLKIDNTKARDRLVRHNSMMEAINDSIKGRRRPVKPVKTK